MSIREAAVRVVLNAKGPMRISEITAKVRRTETIKSDTPENTVSNALQKDSRVVLVDRGVYDAATRVR